MQSNIDQLLNAYREADYERRMFLFLEYRDLRELFTEIDATEMVFENQLQTRKAAPSWFSRLRRAAVLKLSPS